MRGSSTCICSASRPTGKPPRDTCRDKEGWDGGQSLCSLQPWRGAMRRALSAKLTRSFRERAKSGILGTFTAGCPVRRFLHFLAAPAICCGTGRHGLAWIPFLAGPAIPRQRPPPAPPRHQREELRVGLPSESFRSARFSRKQPRLNAATASSRTMRNMNSSAGAPHTPTDGSCQRATYPKVGRQRAPFRPAEVALTGATLPLSAVPLRCCVRSRSYRTIFYCSFGCSAMLSNPVEFRSRSTPERRLQVFFHRGARADRDAKEVLRCP